MKTVTSNWQKMELVRPMTRQERREFPRPIPGILTSISNARLAQATRPRAAVGEVINGHIRCGACGRKRNELIKTLRQFQCARCVTHTQRMGEPQ